MTVPKEVRDALDIEEVFVYEDCRVRVIIQSATFGQIKHSCGMGTFLGRFAKYPK